MNVNFRLKEIYPVILFLMLLMTWSLVGASKPAEAVRPLYWSQIARASDTKEYCKGNPWPFPNNPFCEDDRAQVESKTQIKKP